MQTDYIVTAIAIVLHFTKGLCWEQTACIQKEMKFLNVNHCHNGYQCAYYILHRIITFIII